jgi:magnesium-transporting ATPase (P-type)
LLLYLSCLCCFFAAAQVGIRGEEGVQAVNASDYAIGQFRFLQQLLLKHGRYNYIRMSNVICYMFYKNILASLTMFWFNFFCAFSGQKMYTDGAIQFFNLFYTSLPIVMYGVYDKDVAVSDTIAFPQLYCAGRKCQFFNVRYIFSVSAQAFSFTCVCMRVCVFVLLLFIDSNILGMDSRGVY